MENLNRNMFQQMETARQAAQGDMWDRAVRTSYTVFLDTCLDPSYQRIVLLEARTVLGWDDYRTVDEKFGFGPIRDTLRVLMDAGLIMPQPVEPLAHMLLGTMIEAAIYVAQADDTLTAQEETRVNLEYLLDGLRVKGPRDPGRSD